MSTNDYLKNYDNCLSFCGIELSDTDEEKTLCLQDIKKKYMDETLCLQEDIDECKIISSSNFKELLIFLVKLIKYIYCIRSIYGNVYDVQIILCIGYINLNDYGLELEQLSCIKFPGDKSYQKGFPKTLSDYIKIMQEISTAISSGINLNDDKITKDPFLENYKEFISDFQPWSRLLSTFLNIYARDLLLPNGLPDISKPSSYGSFINNCDDYVKNFNSLLESKSFQSNLIQYLQSVKIGGTKKHYNKKHHTKKHHNKKHHTKKHHTKKHHTRKHHTKKHNKKF